MIAILLSFEFLITSLELARLFGERVLYLMGWPS